jgi:hypothetical protein
MTKHRGPSQRPPVELPQPDTDFGTVPEFRTARGTHDGVRSTVEPRYPKRVPGSQDRADSYAQSTLQPPRHHSYRHMNTRNRLSAVILSSLALMGLGAGADRVYESGQRPYDIAAELTQSHADVAQTLTENGSQGVVQVPLYGDNTAAIASQISTPAAVEEVANILYAQQGNTDQVSTTLAALPAGDLNATELGSLPDGGKVTPSGLVALQNGGNAAATSVVSTFEPNMQ